MRAGARFANDKIAPKLQGYYDTAKDIVDDREYYEEAAESGVQGFWNMIEAQMGGENIYETFSASSRAILQRQGLWNVKLRLTSFDDDTHNEITWSQKGFNLVELYTSAFYTVEDSDTPVRVFVANEVGSLPDEFSTSGHYQESGNDGVVRDKDTIGGQLHFGFVEAEDRSQSAIFFVIHPNSWKPFQTRFRTSKMLEMFKVGFKFVAKKAIAYGAGAAAGALTSGTGSTIAVTAAKQIAPRIADPIIDCVLPKIAGEYLRFIGGERPKYGMMENQSTRTKIHEHPLLRFDECPYGDSRTCQDCKRSTIPERAPYYICDPCDLIWCPECSTKYYAAAPRPLYQQDGPLSDGPVRVTSAPIHTPAAPSRSCCPNIARPGAPHHPHVLERQDLCMYDSGRYNCDICKKTDLNLLPIYHCESCHWDCCPECNSVPHHEHPVVKMDTVPYASGRFSCSICSGTYGCGPVFHCPTCDWDACQKCSAPRVYSSQHAHALYVVSKEERAAGNPSFSGANCNVCKNRAYFPVGWCKACDFDMCRSCMSKEELYYQP